MGCLPSTGATGAWDVATIDFHTVTSPGVKTLGPAEGDKQNPKWPRDRWKKKARKMTF